MTAKLKTKGTIRAFYSDAMNEEGIFYGYGKVLSVTEKKATFLLNGNLYQIVRVRAEFSHTYIPEDGNKTGLYNDPWNKPFITQKDIRILIVDNATDSQISEYSYAPRSQYKKYVRESEAIKHISKTNSYGTFFQITPEGRKTRFIKLPYCIEHFVQSPSVWRGCRSGRRLG